VSREVQRRIRDWLYPWQEQWLDDPSAWKIALKARQIGWSEIASFEALLHGAKHPGHTCFLVSTKVENARRQLLDRIKSRWLPAMQQDPDFRTLLSGAKVNKNSIQLPNGSAVVAAAHKPERLRGNESSSYWFDEIAFWPTRVHEGLVDAVWPQIHSAANPHAVVRLISTPWTKTDNLYHDIWTDADGSYGQFSRHHVDIKEALRRAPQQLGLDFDRLQRQTPRAKLNREYLTQFAEFGDGFWSRAQLLDLADDGESAGDGPLFAGVDLAKVNDHTSVVLLRDGASRLHVEETRLMKSTDYNRQADVLAEWIRRVDPRAVMIDKTAHPSFVDFMRSQPGVDEDAIGGVSWTRDWKVNWTTTLRDHTEQGSITFDFDAVQAWDRERDIWTSHPTRQLLDDLCSVQQGSTAKGHQTFEAPRDTDRGGHADGWAAMLCALAARDMPRRSTTHRDRTEVHHQQAPL